MKVEFINRTGGKMFVDESRIEEYKAAGYKLAADIIDGTAIIVDAPVEKKKSTRRRKED